MMHHMVNVVQLVERQFVALVVVGSSPIVHPIGISPSGKAPDFDSGIRRFESCYPCHLNVWFTSSVGRALDF